MNEIARAKVMEATQKLMAEYDAINGGIAGMSRDAAYNYAARRRAYVNEHIFDVIDNDTAQAAV